MKFIQLMSNKEYFINVAYITGMHARDGGTVVYVDLAHGGTGKGDTLLVADTPEQIFSKIKNAQEI